jgi:hypothetical protein
VSAIRTVRVEPPSGAREAFAVLRVAFHVLFWSGLVIALERGAGGGGGGGARAAGGGTGGARAVGPDRAQLTVDQRAFQDLDADEQRVFLQLEELLTEAERGRAQTGAWPTAEALASDGVTPFAADPIDHVGYQWRHLATGKAVNYLGSAPVGSARPSFVLLILEPDAGIANDPNQPLDEFHHRLPDGTLLHVSVWLGPGAALGDPSAAIARLPVEAGWRQVVTGQSQK